METTNKRDPATSAQRVVEKADDCLKIARAQHEAANAQHLSADKLDELGYALELTAIEIEGNTQMNAGRARGPLDVVKPM